MLFGLDLSEGKKLWVLIFKDGRFELPVLENGFPKQFSYLRMSISGESVFILIE